MGCTLSKNINLVNINSDDIDYFSFDGLTIIAKPCNIYDGDTFSAIFMFNGMLIKYRCRCLGYDSPEMRPLKKNKNRENEKRLALEAKQRFTELLGDLVTLKCGKFDKYGRILVEIYVNNICINEKMIEEGHGRLYDGGHKDEWF